ncbi:MAG: LamG-like jellyroll fold domain-containing protein [Candidatus Paceibacterota bacterium]|jgi:prepilin-type N-terminal cleavage/methylation domain-containing protein
MSKLIKQAFTLIELLVVIAIIGILSGMIVVSMSGVTQKATMAKAQVFSNSLRNSLIMNIQAQYSFDDITDYNVTTKVLNSTVGNVPDSWSDNEGRAYDGPTLKEENECVSGHCLFFDGTDDYIDCGTGASLNLTNSFTLSAWIKPITPDVGYIVGRFNATNAGYMMRWGNVAINFYYGSSSSVSSNSFMSSDDWTLITTTFNEGTVNYYRNGVSVGSDSGITILAADAVNNTIGSRYGGTSTSHFFNGLIDDVRIYNAAIPTSQIKEQYYAGLNSLLANGNIAKEEYRRRINSIASNE